MSTPRILHVTGDGLTAYGRQGGHWLAEAAFEPTAADRERFAAYLRTHRRQHFRLLADIARETLRLESLPRLRGRDRHTLIARKLAQAFPDTPWRLATPGGAARMPPQHEHLSLSALDDSAVLAPWLAGIAASEARLAGMYGISQLLAPVLAHLGQTPPQCLLFLRDAGLLRQAFLVAGQPRFFRTLPAFAGDAGELVAEAAKVQHYLHSQQLLSRGDPLPLFILLPDALILPDQQRLPLPAHHTLTTLFLETLHTRPPRQQFADRELRRTARQANHCLAAACLATLLAVATLPVIADNLLRIRQMRAEIATSQGEAQRQQQRLSELPAATPQQGLSAPRLRQLTTGYGDLLRQQQHPRPAYQQLSHLLDRHPGIGLDALDWHTENGWTHLRIEGQAAAGFTQFVAELQVDRGNRVEVLQSPTATARFTLALQRQP